MRFALPITLLIVLVGALLLVGARTRDDGRTARRGLAAAEPPTLGGRDDGASSAPREAPGVDADAADPASTAVSPADLAERAVLSRNEAALTEHLATYRRHAEAVRERLVRVALDGDVYARVRVRARWLLLRIDDGTPSEPTLRVLAAHLVDREPELRRQAVLGFPVELPLTRELVPGLTALAVAEPSETSVAATEVLGRWGAMGREALVDCLSRALSAEDEYVRDRALESPLLVSLDAPELAVGLVALMRDRRLSMAWLREPKGPGLAALLQRYQAALVAASRLPPTTRARMRRFDDFPAGWPEKGDRVLATLYMDGPSSVADEELLEILDGPSRARTWALLRVLLDQDAVPRRLMLPVAQLAFRVSHREGLSRLLGSWLAGLPREDADELLALDGTEYFAWRMSRLR